VFDSEQKPCGNGNRQEGNRDVGAYIVTQVTLLLVVAGLRISFAIETMEELPGIRRKKRLRELFKMAASMGYDGIELHISDPRKTDVSFLKELAVSHGLEVPAIGTGPTYTLHGISFLSSPGARKRAVDRLREYIRVARVLRAVVIVGLIRGRLAGGRFTRYKAWKTIQDCLVRGAALAEEQGVILAIEPINRYETDLINTLAEALSMAADVDSESVKIMADTFHMNIEEASIAHSLRQSRGKLVHFHVADSNRLSPGKGHLDFASIISELKGIGYEGYLSAEILPKPSLEQASLDTIQYLKPLLSSGS